MKILKKTEYRYEIEAAVDTPEATNGHTDPAPPGS
jgi:hypothetical protein